MAEKIINLPDGRSLTLTGQETPEQISALKSKLREKYKPEQAQAMAMDALPKPEYDLGADLSRGLGLTARSAIQGATAIPAMVADVPISIYNELADRNLPSAASSIERGLTRLGLPQPQNAMERFSTSAAESLSGLGAGIKAAQLLSKGAGPVAQGVAQTLATAIPQQTAAVVGGAGGQEAAREMGAGPIGQAAGALAGSFVPSGAASAARGAVTSARQGRAGYFARPSDELRPLAEAQKAAAGAMRNEMRDMRINITSKASNKLVKKLDSKLKDFDLDPDLSPVTNSIVKKIKNAASTGSINLNYLDQYRRQLRGARQEDSAIAGAVRGAIDDIVNGLSPQDFDAKGGDRAVKLLNQFRKDWAKASKFDAVAEVLQKADGDPNRIKAGLTRFLNNEKNTLGFNKAEIEALKDAARAGTTEKILKMGGKFGLDFGTSLTPGNTVLPALSGALVNPVVPALGTAARSAQKYVARGKAENLLKIIENGGMVTQKELLALNPKDAARVIKAIRATTAITASQEEQ